jgi:hypothetical protein
MGEGEGRLKGHDRRRMRPKNENGKQTRKTEEGGAEDRGDHVRFLAETPKRRARGTHPGDTEDYD